MSRYNFVVILEQLLGFFGKLLDWTGSIYVYDGGSVTGPSFRDVLIGFIVLSVLATFIHALILNRKVKRNEDV